MFKFFVAATFVAPLLGLSTQEAAQYTQKAVALIGDSLASIEVPGSARDVALNALLRNVAGTSKVTPASRPVYVNVSTICDAILQELTTAKTDFAGFTVINDVANCLTQHPDSDVSTDGVDSKQGTHEACRHGEASDMTTIEGNCFTAVETMRGISCPTDPIPTPAADGDGSFTDADYFQSSHIGNWEGFFNHADSHFGGYQSTWASNVETCTDALDGHDQKRSTCEGEQSGFEESYCRHVETYAGWCKNRWECYESAACTYKQTTSAMNELNANANRVARVIIHIKCLINDVILAESETCLADPLSDACCPEVPEDDARLDQYKIEPPTGIPDFAGCDTQSLEADRVAAVSYNQNFSSNTGAWRYLTTSTYACAALDAYPNNAATNIDAAQSGCA